MKELIGLLVVSLLIYLFIKFLKHIEKKDVALKETEKKSENIISRQAIYPWARVGKKIIQDPKLPPLGSPPNKQPSPITNSAFHIPKVIPTREAGETSTYERERFKALLRDIPNNLVNSEKLIKQKTKLHQIRSR